MSSDASSDPSIAPPGEDGTESASYIVGIGASAGGLQPLEEFFRTIPTDTGAAFVVVQHLSPDFKSLMLELLGRHTSMQIHRAEDGMPVEPNSIYLIPPASDLRLENGQLQVKQQKPLHGPGPHFPIDLFLNSLAKEAGPRAVAVILSGTGSDGSRGIRAINEADGLVFVQDPETAQFDGMPREAMATGMANHVLRPSAIATAISDLASHSYPDLPTFGIQDDSHNPSVQAILEILAREEQIDFTHYKPGTMSRRVERRQLISGTRTLGEYTDLLAQSPDERAALRNDLLITVTSFFRDTRAWDRLTEQHLPELVRSIPEDEPIRVWVTACATGEEAYSMAMTLREVTERLGRKKQDIKIFATDIDSAALDRASSGIYPESIVADVSDERRQRFFVPRGDHLQVGRELREMIIFAPHNLVKDAPFTRMHIVTCRNALIYMQVPLQQHVLRMLHFALVRRGLLFLGSAETAGELDNEFESIDRRWNLYAKVRDIRLPLDSPLPTGRTSSRQITFPSARRVANNEPMIESVVRSLVRS